MQNLNKSYNSLAGKFLIASPSMNDPRFAKCIIYMVSDNIDGSMGIIINKPAINISFDTILETVELNKNETLADINKPKVFYGGPVDLDKGFILHTNDYSTKEKYTELDKNLVLSSNFSILKDIIEGKGPTSSLLALGYAGWYSNQLVRELKQNSWLEAEMDTEILFSHNISEKWELCLAKVGISKKNIKSSNFSSFSGSA